jgi:hypothetical protein
MPLAGNVILVDGWTKSQGIVRRELGGPLHTRGEGRPLLGSPYGLHDHRPVATAKLSYPSGILTHERPWYPEAGCLGRSELDELVFGTERGQWVVDPHSPELAHQSSEERRPTVVVDEVDVRFVLDVTRD